MSDRLLYDGMGPRPITARWVIQGILTLETAMHLSGEGADRVDMPLLRDTRDGNPLLTGSTFAGALRNALADRLLGYGRLEHTKDESGQLCPIRALFGGSRGDDDGSQSPLVVFDSIGEIPAGQGVEIRDGVSISPTTGIAEDHKKYDYEVIPAGTQFPVRLDLILPAPANHTRDTVTAEKLLLEALAAALGSFSHGNTGFGARRSRGLGRVSAVWSARRFDLSSSAGWLQWALSPHEYAGGQTAASGIQEALEAVAPEELKPLQISSDARSRVLIDLELQITSDILIRSSGTELGAPDVSHLHSGGTAVLPGTSLAGVLRSHGLRIAGLVRASHGDENHWIDRLFGPRFEGRHPQQALAPRASRLHVGESTLSKSEPQRQTRVAIDRFTQGAVDTALFDEQTEVGGCTRVSIELRNPFEGEVGLVLLVVKDLLEGLLPVGGTSSVGRGVLCGWAEVRWHEGDGTPSLSATIKPQQPPIGDGAERIDSSIRAFHSARTLQEPLGSEHRNRPGGKV